MSKPSNAGIVTDADGQRVIPESRRPDGSIRPAIKVRPGYMPPEDVPKYQIPLYRRKAVAAEAEAKTAPETPTPARTIPSAVPGAAPATVPGAVPNASPEVEPSTSASSTAAKNAKRREARRKAAANSAEQSEAKAESKSDSASPAEPPEVPVDTASAPAEDRDKKIRGLKKKLKQAKELQTKRDGGESLLPEQIAKVIRISDLTRELESLGLGDDGEEKEK
ncbi:rna binding protein [Ophiostoma piceae UAMH 11346]|uniref:Rna binding protein n=1 Tax=Ophiostoma piceae (strain UAMH 11346) TaxID=1262450 RepID=S3C5H3_OPHP1|nr:rna binding protein [Ophiostoma piceae UAMH 11346]